MSSDSLTRKRFCSPGLARALVRLGFETQEALQQLSDNEPTKKAIAALAEIKGIEELEILKALAKDLGVELLDLRNSKKVEQIRKNGLVAELDEKFILEHVCLPLERKDSFVEVGLVDPLDLEAISQLEFALGAKVRPKLVSETEVRQALARILGFQHAEEIEFGDQTSIKSSVVDLELEASVPADSMSEEVGSATAPVVKFVNQILHDAYSAKASDVHLEPSSNSFEVRFRIDGMMTPQLSIPKRLQSYVTARIKILASMDITEKRRPQDGRFRMRGAQGQAIDVRASTVPTPFGEKIVLRLLRSEVGELRLGSLAMPSELLQRFEDMLKTRDRIVLVCGPTGSGKTTTLYSALNNLRESHTNIVTVEDPIEIRLDGITQIQVDPKIGVTFASGLRSILRQDPDIILVGEIRDLETAQIAFQAAQTGHFVLSTLHTNTAVSAIVRLTDLGLEPFIIASALGGVVAQRLLRSVCLSCSAPDTNEASLASASRFGVDAARLRRGAGCNACEQSGYRGRIAAYSLLTINGPLRELIRNRAGEEQIRQVAKANGMSDLFQSALKLAEQGLTTLDEVERVIGLGDFIDNQNSGSFFSPRAEAALPTPEPPANRTIRSEDDLLAIQKSEKGSIESLAEEHRRSSTARAEKTHARVLLVDDDDGVRAVLTRILRKADFEVCEASNGYEALDKIAGFVPDVIVSDLVMPGMDGKELVTELRQYPDTAKIPVLMLTGSDDEENEIELISLGANDFVSKSSSPALVITRVKRLLGAFGS